MLNTCKRPYSLTRPFYIVSLSANKLIVETVGDCYVAAAGVPEARADHAVAIARFARDCMVKFAIVTKQLEVALGPDTNELALRTGLHSVCSFWLFFFLHHLTVYTISCTESNICVTTLPFPILFSGSSNSWSSPW